MRAIWKGSVAFGLVNVPVRLYSATEDHDLELHQVHDADGGRIRYERRCEVCGRKVAYEHIDRAFEQGDRTVVLTDDDLSSLPEESSREIDVLQFVPTDQVDPIMLERSYYLAPEATAKKAYALLRQALVDTDQTAIARFTLRQRTRLGALRVRDDVLTLQRLLWNDEVREPEFDLDTDARVSETEVTMAARLVESLSGDFTPEKFTDDYAEQLEQLVEAKLEHGDDIDTAATFGEASDTGGADVVDLMDALRQSVERARQHQNGGGTPKKTAAKKTAAKKSSAKKSSAKKTSAKKASAKKTEARKTTASRRRAS